MSPHAAEQNIIVAVGAFLKVLEDVVDPVLSALKKPPSVEDTEDGGDDDDDDVSWQLKQGSKEAC